MSLAEKKQKLFKAVQERTIARLKAELEESKGAIKEIAQLPVLKILSEELAAVHKEFEVLVVESIQEESHNLAKSVLSEFAKLGEALAETKKAIVTAGDKPVKVDNLEDVPREVEVTNLKDLKIPAPVVNIPPFPEFDLKAFMPAEEPNEINFERNVLNLVTQITVVYNDRTEVFRFRRNSDNKVIGVTRTRVENA